MTNPNSAAQAAMQRPIYEAIFILTEEADSLSECHTRTPGDWAGEPEAKARYDHILDVVDALSKLRTPVAGEEKPVAWRYQTPTGWHATTDAQKAVSLRAHHPVEPLYAAPQASAEYERGHADGWAAGWNQAIKQPQADKDGGQQRAGDVDVGRLMTAAKGMTRCYSYVWDRTDGSLAVFPENVRAFDAAFDALRVATGEVLDDDTQTERGERDA